jgi:PiT family inorganic phosphate transporter
MLTLIIIIVVIALAFDFLNGFHDAANSIATVVCTRVLSPIQAVAWAAFFNFVAAFAFGTGVAKTVGEGLIDLSRVDHYVVMSGLLGAIIWNIITWYLALPTSSSHALISGYAGAAIAKCGVSVLIAEGWLKVLAFIVLSPTIGLALGLLNMIVVTNLCRNARPRFVDSVFRKLQLVSAGFYSLGHGTNDAQKTMGIIVALLVTAGKEHWTTGGMVLFGREHSIAWWIILSCHAAIALGTFLGGWRIVKTMGDRITRLQPVGGFCAETAGATTLLGTALWGIPVSTTHVITGAILGVGSARNVKSVRWIWGEKIVMAWVLTLPCTAFIAAVLYLILHWTILPVGNGILEQIR